MSKTLFEKICDREIPADIVYEDEYCVAFKDINPQAPFHVQLVPRKPITMLASASPEDQALLGHLLLTAPRSEEHTSELQSLMRISYAVFCLKKTTHIHMQTTKTNSA